jgi:hypothetical protein
MDDQVYVVRLDQEEHGLVVNVLYEKHNELVRNNGLFEVVDRVLMKVIKAKHKRSKRSDFDFER